MYNYQTTSADDPKNLVLLCTTQGVAVQADAPGAQRLYHHSVDDDGQAHKYWLEAERTRHAVGGAQQESEDEAAAAAARGKATASVIGVRALGTRFNVLMTIQVPLKQAKLQAHGALFGGGESGLPPPVPMLCGASFCVPMPAAAASFGPPRPSRMVKRSAPPPVGTSNAARVSRGSHAGRLSPLTLPSPARHEAQHVTVTVVSYSTVAGGVPSEADVAAAIDDLEALYAACSDAGRLADSGFDFMKAELTVADVGVIANKLTQQPYAPPTARVQNHTVFPSS